MNDSAENAMEQYLGRLRKRLRGMNDSDAREIVAELRAHIVEKSSASGQMTSAAVQATLVALGTPEELARLYTTDELLARAVVTRSPLRIIGGVFHMASLSAAGFLVLIVTVTGYTIGALSVLAAFAKLIHPHTGGIWLIPNGDDLEISVRMGFGAPPANGRELLGKWFVPVALFAGCGVLVLTTKFAVWCVQKFRQSRALPGGAN